VVSSRSRPARAGEVVTASLDTGHPLRTAHPRGTGAVLRRHRVLGRGWLHADLSVPARRSRTNRAWCPALSSAGVVPPRDELGRGVAGGRDRGRAHHGGGGTTTPVLRCDRVDEQEGVVAAVPRPLDEPGQRSGAPASGGGPAEGHGPGPTSRHRFATTRRGERHESLVGDAPAPRDGASARGVAPSRRHVSHRLGPRGLPPTPRRSPAAGRAPGRRVTATTAAASSTPPGGRRPETWVDATPAEVRAVLTPESAAEFDRQWREASSRAADTYDLTVVHACLEAWRRRARWLPGAPQHGGYGTRGPWVRHARRAVA
jgi:hypothetical protein